MFSDKAIDFIHIKALPLSIALSIAFSCPALLNAADEHSYAQEIEQNVAEDKVYLLENIRQKVTIPSEKTIVEALLTEDAPQAVMLFQKQLREYSDPALDKLSTSRISAYNLALDRSTSLPKSSISPSSRKQQPIVVKTDTTQQSSRHRLHVVLPSAQQHHSIVTADSIKHSAKTRSNSEHLSVIKVDTTKHSSKQRMNIALSSDVSKEEKIVAGPTTSTLQFGSFENRKNAETLAKEISQNAPVEIVQKGQMFKVQLKTHYGSTNEAAAAAKKLPVKAIVIPSV